MGFWVYVRCQARCGKLGALALISSDEKGYWAKYSPQHMIYYDYDNWFHVRYGLFVHEISSAVQRKLIVLHFPSYFLHAKCVEMYENKESLKTYLRGLLTGTGIIPPHTRYVLKIQMLACAWAYLYVLLH